MNIERVKKAIEKTHVPGDGRVTMSPEIRSTAPMYGSKPFYVWIYANNSTGKVVELWQKPDELDACDAFQRYPGQYGSKGLRMLRRISEVVKILSDVE